MSSIDANATPDEQRDGHSKSFLMVMLHCMYKDAFENHDVADTETLSLNYLPASGQSSVK